MFSKKKRVTKEIFQTIMKKGRILSGSLFVLRYIPYSQSMYAVVAPKSVAKQANIRNKLRRQGYAALRAYPLKSCQAIFFYKKEVKNAPYSLIKEDIGLLLQKIKL